MSGSINKRVRSNDEGGRWEGLNPEVLALIFVRLPAEERVRTVGLVCRSWLEAVAGPFCWTEIDIEQWGRRCNRLDFIDLAVKKLVRRSKFTFRRLSAYKLGDSAFSYLANCARSLKVLQIPMSEVTDKMIQKHAESLSNISVLDISNCLKITSKGLESFGNQCKSLTHLKRNMPPPEWERPAPGFSSSRVDDTEAMIIANTMTGLHQLELCYGRFGDSGLRALLTKCEKLAHLDILGCWNLELEGDLKGKCEQLAVYRSPWFDYEEDDVSSNSGDESSDSDSIS